MKISIYAVHGILNTLAFIVILPLGAIIALMRNCIGPSWYNYHVFLQLTGMLFVFIASSLVLYKKITNKNNPKEEENIYKKYHKIIGPIIVTLVFIQLLWATMIKKYVNKPLWYIVHGILALLIIVGGWVNVALARKFMK